jgi:hypothetical protein
LRVKYYSGEKSRERERRNWSKYLSRTNYIDPQSNIFYLHQASEDEINFFSLYHLVRTLVDNQAATGGLYNLDHKYASPKIFDELQLRIRVSILVMLRYRNKIK